jgi:hypothetical protein
VNANDEGLPERHVVVKQDLDAWLQGHDDDDPIEGCVLSEWVLVMAHEGPDGFTYVNVIDSPNLALHHHDGLLHEALHGRPC